MNYFYAVLELLGGLGAFLLGFKILSDNLVKIANNKLKKIMEKTAKNRFAGVGIGLAVTAIVQSSSVTTVMVVGFVNTQMISLFQATSMIMGANIGTTVTAQIAALESFDVSKIGASLAAIGFFIALLGKKDRMKNLGNSLSGLGLVFLGLIVMSSSMNVFKESSTITNMLLSIDNPLLLLLIGVMITAIVQSSSAVTTIIISMVGAGMIIGNDPNDVLFVVLGSNIGTCVTALISAIGTNVNAKRASIIHLLFNVFGTVVFSIVLIIWSSFMEDTLCQWFKYPATQIAMFHTLFNLVNTIIFLPFINLFVKISKIIINDKVNEETPIFDERLLVTPILALNRIEEEMKKAFTFSFKSCSIMVENLYKKTKMKESYNEKSKVLNDACFDYLSKISYDQNEEMNLRIRDIYRELIDIKRIIEINENILKTLEEMSDNNQSFSLEILESIQKMFFEVNSLFNSVYLMITQKINNSLCITLSKEKISQFKKYLIEEHVINLNNGICNPNNSGVFISLVSDIDRLSDHIYAIGICVQERNEEKKLIESSAF